jgi:hypothetical protein
MDLIFSDRVNGILRRKVAGMVPPANYLLQPDPILLSSVSSTSVTASSTSPPTNENGPSHLLEGNRTRRLFAKNSQQDKVIPPPKVVSQAEHEQRKRAEFRMAENQRVILELISGLLQDHPHGYGKFADILLTRISSSLALPTDEQYLEVLPKRTGFDFDVFTRKIFVQNPILVSLLCLLASGKLLLSVGWWEMAHLTQM